MGVVLGVWEGGCVGWWVCGWGGMCVRKRVCGRMGWECMYHTCISLKRIACAILLQITCM